MQGDTFSIQSIFCPNSLSQENNGILKKSGQSCQERLLLHWADVLLCLAPSWIFFWPSFGSEPGPALPDASPPPRTFFQVFWHQLAGWSGGNPLVEFIV